ncbi:MAG: hypothetical protein KatS3mg108_3210 [Isosphaeraceae bacterium]|nr:MAG: hypothetical protein KatS3mg108_3210 [Isosphaeraceae bacterium]
MRPWRAKGMDRERLCRLLASLDPTMRLVSEREYRRWVGRHAARRGWPRAVPVGLDVGVEGSGWAEREPGSSERAGTIWVVPIDSTWRKLSEAGALRRLWKVVLAAAVERAVTGLRLSESELEDRLDVIGRTAYDEAVWVMREDGWLRAGEAGTAAYGAVCGRFLALWAVEPGMVSAHFTAIEDPERVAAVLRQGLELERLVEQTRPPGAEPEPETPAGMVEGLESEAEDDEDWEPEDGAVLWDGAQKEERGLVRRAVRAAERGNHVRALILWERAARSAGAGQQGVCEGRSRSALAMLAGRLERTLEDGSRASDWQRVLEPLRAAAVAGVRSRAGRVLFSLQKACVDRERPAGRLDLVGWLVTGGRRPLKREVPDEWQVQRLRHLKEAAERLRGVGIEAGARQRLARRIEESLERAEEELRHVFGPQIEASLREGGLEPKGVVERVGESKLVEELLDRAVAQGFITAGELRDAIARNVVKLPDPGMVEWIYGDRLLRTDRALARHLEGVYRGAEIYLRGLQKGSSVVFGTRPGRWLTWNVVLPFGGAFVVLEGLQHLVEPVVGLVSRAGHSDLAGAAVRLGQVGSLGVSAIGPVSASVDRAWEKWAEPSIHLMTGLNVVVLGLVVLGLMRSARLRRGVARVVRSVGRGLGVVVGELPGWLAARLGLVELWQKVWVRRLAGWVVVPGLVGMGCAGVGLRLGARGVGGWLIGLGGYGVTVGLVQTRVGRWLGETLMAGWEQWVRWVGHDLVPGLVRATLRFFRRGLERLDQLLFAVDEFFRFRRGDRRWAIGLKAVGGTLWGGVRYVVRLGVATLVEPQVNPIKHFPVVTVAHKVTLPLILGLTPFFARTLGMGWDAAYGLAFFLQLLLPGVFGFLVWELKENWKLYEANRPRALGAAIVGSHGETVVRLLRPGFHSGTVAKAYQRLRGEERGRHRVWESLHEVEREVSRFVERELLALLGASRRLGDEALRVGGVRLGPRRIEVGIEHEGYPGEPLEVGLTEREGWLVAEVVGSRPGWLDRLDGEARLVAANGLAGLYARAGVDFATDQARHLVPGEWVWDGRRPVVWWPSRRGGLRAEVELDGEAGDGSSLAERLRFSWRPILWKTWVESWEREASGPSVPLVVEPSVLPVGGDQWRVTGKARSDRALDMMT